MLFASWGVRIAKNCDLGLEKLPLACGFLQHFQGLDHSFWLSDLPAGKLHLYIHSYITNCRQYCLGLLGLISAVLMSRMEVKLIKPPQMSHPCGTSKPCQSAQTSELVSMRN